MYPCFRVSVKRLMVAPYQLTSPLLLITLLLLIVFSGHVQPLRPERARFYQRGGHAEPVVRFCDDGPAHRLQGPRRVAEKLWLFPAQVGRRDKEGAGGSRPGGHCRRLSYLF